MSQKPWMIYVCPECNAQYDPQDYVFWRRPDYMGPLAGPIGHYHREKKSWIDAERVEVVRAESPKEVSG